MVCANRPHVAAVCSFVVCRVPRSELRIDGSHRVTHIEGMPLATKYYKTRLALAVAHTLSPASTGDVPTAATSLLDGATCVVIVLDCTKVGAAAAQLSLPPPLPFTTCALTTALACPACRFSARSRRLGQGIRHRGAARDAGGGGEQD